MNKSATLSKCNLYRYDLFRVWDKEKEYLMFIGLNPSTADAEVNDKTIERCIAFAETLGYGGICMCNLFAFRTTYPSDMKKSLAPIGKDNDYYLKKHAAKAAMVIAAWGNDGVHLSRYKEVLSLLKEINIYSLHVNKTGQPKHPLYIAGNVKPSLYQSAINN